MKTKEEAVADLLEENGKYEVLVKLYRGDSQALEIADWLFQNGVRVSEIGRLLERS